MVAESRRMTAPPRTVSAPVPRLLALSSVQLLEPCLSRLTLPPVMTPEKVVAALGLVMSVAVDDDVFWMVPAPLA